MFNQKFKKGSFFRNFTVLMSGEALAHAFNMVINIILARKLAPDSYGLYAFLLTLPYSLPFQLSDLEEL